MDISLAVAAEAPLAAERVVEQPGAPPWLWFVTAFFKANPLSQFLMVGLTVYATVLPFTGGHFSLRMLGFFGVISLVVSTLLAALPYLAVGLGSLTLFFPARRAKWVEEKYALSDPPELPVIREIADFVAAHAPRLELRANLLRGNMLCFVYPAGAKSARLAIFGGLVRLWATDRAQAEAVLLHEIGHYRRGDAFHLGAGSAFEFSLRVAVIALAIYIVPWLFNLLRTSLSGGYHPNHLVAGFVLQLLAYLLTGMSVVWPVLAATWVAEYGADFQAAAQVGPEPVIAALANAPEEGGPLACFLNRLTHPSLKRRQQMLELPPQRALLRMSMVFPLTLFYVTAINLSSIMLSALLFGQGLMEMGRNGHVPIMPSVHEMEMRGLRILGLFLLLAATLFCWPFWHARYASFWSPRPRSDRRYAKVYAQAGGLVLLLMVVALVLWAVMYSGVIQWWRQVSG